MSSLHLDVSGFVPLSTVDYPGRLSAVVFCQGCTWRCPYCHNAHLRACRRGEHAWAEVWHSLQQRRGWLEAVVFSGGEPLLQEGLPEVLSKVKTAGFLVGLHTTGMYSSAFEACLPYLDWVGFDIKAPWGEAYDRITGLRDSWHQARRSLSLLLDRGLPRQLRTTVDPRLHTDAHLAWLQHNFGSELIFQPARPATDANKATTGVKLW